MDKNASANSALALARQQFLISIKQAMLKVSKKIAI